MTTRSITITGLIVSLIGFLFQHSGLDIPQTDVESFVFVSMQIGSLIIVWVDRYLKGDVTLLGKRK